MRIHKNQTGSAVIILLVILILAVVGFGGYYVWHTQKSSTKTTATISPTKPATPASTTKNIDIKEWGVKASYSAPVTLQYSIPSSLPNYAYFGSSELVAISTGCTAAGGAAGIIDRYTAGQTVPQTDVAQSSDPTAQAYAATLSKSAYAHVSNYYYFYKHPQGLCGGSNSSSDAQIEDLQGTTEDAVKAALANLQAE